MRDITVMETLEEMDKNGDGKISLVEFIDDLWKVMLILTIAIIRIIIVITILSAIFKVFQFFKTL